MAGPVHWILKVLHKAGWLHIIAHLVCIGFFSVQMYRLVEHLVHPTMTHTVVREVPLKNMDFPLDINICVRPSLNSTVDVKGLDKMTPICMFRVQLQITDLLDGVV